jgi:sugar lactone lactonase YvrE
MFEPVANTPAVFAECPVWLPGRQCLCWIDCAAGKLFALHWRERAVSLLASMPGTLFWGLVKRDHASLLLLTASGAYIVEASGRAETGRLPGSIDPVLGNDAKIDRRGALWLGQVRSAPDARDGSLVRIHRGRARTVIAGLGIPNGPAFSADGASFYAVDSLARSVTSFALDEEGAATNPRLLLSAGEAEGQPDGLAVDGNGRVIVALFGGGALLSLDPVGETVERLVAPFAQPTSCAFGGHDLDTLFVTVARGPWPHDRRNPGTPVAEPALPSLYALPMPVPGLAEPDLAPTTLTLETEAP